MKVNSSLPLSSSLPSNSNELDSSNSESTLSNNELLLSNNEFGNSLPNELSNELPIPPSIDLHELKRQIDVLWKLANICPTCKDYPLVITNKTVSPVICYCNKCCHHYTSNSDGILMPLPLPKTKSKLDLYDLSVFH